MSAWVRSGDAPASLVAPGPGPGASRRSHRPPSVGMRRCGRQPPNRYVSGKIPRVSFLDRADDAVGDAVDALVRRHHRRRLARIGWLKAFEPAARLWADADPPPRPGNHAEVLID